MSNRNKGADQRKNRRFQAPKDVFVGIGPNFDRIGRLRDVSMDGLAFRYIGNGETLNGSYVDVFMDEGDFYLGKVPIEIVSDVEVIEKSSSDHKTLRRCCIKFKKLTSEQKAKLQELIERHAAGEA